MHVVAGSYSSRFGATLVATEVPMAYTAAFGKNTNAVWENTAAVWKNTAAIFSSQGLGHIFCLLRGWFSIGSVDVATRVAPKRPL